MPVTKTAKRALRSSKRKGIVNKNVKVKLEKVLRAAKNAKDEKSVNRAVSLIDKAAKKNLIHKNKASRLKSSLSKLLIAKRSSIKKSKTKESKSK